MIKTLAFLFIVSVCWPTLSRQKELKSMQRDSQAGTRTDPRNSPPVEDYLNDEIVRMITKATRINVYHLKPFVTDVTEMERKKKYFAEYEVLGQKKANKKRAAELKSALLDRSNYITDYTNKCTFTATIGLEIVLKKEKLDVLISYRCEKLLFLRNATEKYWEVRSLERFEQLAHGLFKGPLT